MTCAAIVCSASRLSPQHEPTLASAVAALLRAPSPAPASPPAAESASLPRVGGCRRAVVRYAPQGANVFAVVLGFSPPRVFATPGFRQWRGGSLLFCVPIQYDLCSSPGSGCRALPRGGGVRSGRVGGVTGVRPGWGVQPGWAARHIVVIRCTYDIASRRRSTAQRRALPPDTEELGAPTMSNAIRTQNERP